jgi:hypothetical protein
MPDQLALPYKVQPRETNLSGRNRQKLCQLKRPAQRDGGARSPDVMQLRHLADMNYSYYERRLLMFAALNVDAMVRSSLPHCGLFP